MEFDFLLPLGDEGLQTLHQEDKTLRVVPSSLNPTRAGSRGGQAGRPPGAHGAGGPKTI